MGSAIVPVDQPCRPIAGRFRSFNALRAPVAAVLLFSAAFGTGHAQDSSQQRTAPPDPPAVDRPAGKETPAVVVDGDSADALLGKAVESANGDDMGRVVDVIIDRAGMIRAAVIDFGGFLGVGTRKIAIDWRVLNFAKTRDMKSIVADLSQDQLRTAPAYKPGEPVVIVGRADAAPAAQQAPASPSAPKPSQPPAPPAAQDAPAPNR